MGERIENILRIPLGIICGIICAIWTFVATILVVVQWFHVILLGSRHHGLAQYTNNWLTYFYALFRYMMLISNERPWPFGPAGSYEIDPVDMM